jgi:hypothetical protein
MRKLTLSLFVAFALCTAAAVAQTTPGGSQGTTGSSPSMSQPGQQPGTQPGDTSGSMGQTDQTNNPNQAHSKSEKSEKGEKKLKGCIQSQGGQYVLETKKGKAVALTGQDVSAHVGHEVSVKGTWESGGGSMSATSSSGSASGSEKTFNVASVDMISDSCGGKNKEKGSSGNMGTSPSSTSPSSTGNTGNTSQPPQ